MSEQNAHERIGVDCILDGLRCCPLPEGNESRHPFWLSVHGAWMLALGIREYAHLTAAHYEEGELASYCWERINTALIEATNLRDWAQGVSPDYMQRTIRELDELLAELTAEAKRFADLSAQEEDGCSP